VERDEVVADVGAAVGSREGWTWPDVAEGDSVEVGARCGPDGIEALDEDVPEGCDWDSAGVSVDLAFGVKEIYLGGRS
jgi:hypothetical protein